MAEQPNTGGNRSVQPGSIEIKSLILSGGSNNVELTNIIQEWNIYENIYENFLTINMIILDGSSLFTLFPLTGDETLQVEFKTPDPAFDKSFKYSFKIVSITDLAQAEEVRVAQYRLRGVSPEAFNDWTKRVRKSFPGGNSNGGPIKKMVEDIYKDFLKVGDLELKSSETEGNHVYVIPNMRPTDAIKFLSREAKSAEFPASNYLFFGNADGYFFKTFDEIISRPDHTKKIDRYVLTPKHYDEKNEAVGLGRESLNPGESPPSFDIGQIQSLMQQDKPAEFRKVTQYQFPKILNTEEKVQLGGFDNTLFYLDLNKSTYETTKYSYKEDYDKLKWIDNTKVVKQDSSLMNLKGDSHHRYILVNKDNDNVNIDKKHEFLHLMTASVAMMNYVQCNLLIPGDSTKRVGDRIEIAFPEFSRFEETMKLESGYLSGHYTVTAIRHTYNPGASGYTTYMECLKNTFKKDPEKAAEPAKKAATQTQNTQGSEVNPQS